MASILVVDDRPDSLMVVGRHLSAANHDVQLVEDAESALRRIEAGEQFDLFILDVVLPGMSGYELCKRIRDREDTKDVPVLFLTGERGKLPDKLHGFAIGANDYIAKPADKLELVARVDVMLRLKSALQVVKRSNEQLAILVDERTRALKEALESLERQRNLWETMVRRLPTAVLVYDAERNLITANDVAEQKFGEIAAGTSMLATPLRDFFDGAAWGKLRDGRKASQWIDTRDRGRRLLEAELSVLSSERRWLLHVVDITEREALLEETRGYEVSELLEEIHSLKEQLQGGYKMSRVVGVSPAMARIHRVVNQLRNSNATVVIEGESGTGKELVARAIHFDGALCERPFVAVNCGAIPASLAESELFGHVKGAFTGADRDAPGLFRQAEGGTLFLDEIGQCPPEVQLKLLRVLQSRELRPVGGSHVFRVDTRVIAATNEPLEQLVKEARFREDLYYRLAVVTIEIPPLRDRPEDIPVLAKHFLELKTSEAGRTETLTGISRDAMRQLERYPWEGNVRQLENVLEGAVVLSNGPLVQAEDLPDSIRAHVVDHGTPASFSEEINEGLPEPVSEEASFLLPRRIRLAEKETIVDALNRTGWNKLAAAKLLGIGKSSLYRKLKELGITPGGLRR